MQINREILQKINNHLWEIPKNYQSFMRVPARVYADSSMLEEILKDQSLVQLINVTSLPGIRKYAIAMPDVHEGYGFPIGGVAAVSYPNGVISPGGIGYDINCGVRLLISRATYKDISSYLPRLAVKIYQEVPSGVGRGGRLKLDRKTFDQVLERGVNWAFQEGYAGKEDLEHIESLSYLSEAEPDLVSDRARDRGRDQLGTMGAGNHFVEVGRVEKIFDDIWAKKLGLFLDQISVLIHTGSRGLGHQIATDYIKRMLNAMPKYKIEVPDRELACAPYSEVEGREYFQAMSAAANFAWANRQLITWEVRGAWESVLGESGGKLDLLYDVAHNIAKIETHKIDGLEEKLIVHRKGATRAFDCQPVIIPGSMGTASYILMGTKESMEQTFGSSCHGAGRRMSRHAAKRQMSGQRLKGELEKQGITVVTGNVRDLAEEAPFAYKDVDSVVDIVDKSGIAKKVARLRPLIVVKG